MVMMVTTSWLLRNRVKGRSTTTLVSMGLTVLIAAQDPLGQPRVVRIRAHQEGRQQLRVVLLGPTLLQHFARTDVGIMPQRIR